MSSYYERVTGNLSPSKIADSKDINDIQSNIQHAFIDMIKDTFGEGCILDEDEDALKLIPTPDHIDQLNTNYDKDIPTISFYDTYFRQKITIKKSEIQAIRVQMINESNIAPTIFAEIRDMDMNLKKETNIILNPTTKEETSINDPVNVDFIFNLQHLPIGDYYFIIRPVDLSSIDSTLNGDESIYDTPNASMFQIKYDIDGNYNEGLDASYNGVDYLPSNILPNIHDTTGITEGRENNCDLYFEHIYSSGNTYLINPGACMVLGQKIYPVDTHVTINGPSKFGHRTDLVYLDDGGLLHVLEGQPYTGDKIYPIETSGFKIAYITTYQNSTEVWTCPACGTINNGNLPSCYVCNTTTNNKIPLIEQDDENGMTRQRDILERLRRLEKKMDYQIQNNIPSRIKYTCPVDPTMAIDAEKVQDGVDNLGNPTYRYVNKEDSYGLSSKQDANGNTILTFNDNISKEYSWSIIKKITTVEAKVKKTSATIVGTDVKIPTKKPSKIKSNQYYTLTIKKKVVKTTEKTKEKSQDGNTYTYTQSYDTSDIGVKGLSVTFFIKQNGTVKKTIKNKLTNTSGEIKLNLWDYDLKKGTYVIVAKYDQTKVSNKIIISDDATISISKGTEVAFKITESSEPIATTNVNQNTFTGDDSFYKDNINIDTNLGEISIAKTNPSKKTYEAVSNIPDNHKFQTSQQAFVINPTTISQQSTYGMMNFQIHEDCWVKKIRPYVTGFENIKAFKIILFKNDKVFNLNTSRTSYIKNVSTKDSAKTPFPNLYESEWVDLRKLDKKENETKKEKVNNKEITYQRFILKKAYAFDTGGIHLPIGTYSLLVLGKLDKTQKAGKIVVTQYHTSDAAQYGAISKVKGTYNPSTVFLEKNSLINATWKLSLGKYIERFANSEGTIVSKTINTTDSIKQCAMEANFDIPPGCDVETFVSNNGGKTYIQMRNDNSTKNNNVATFNGLGHEFRWKIILHTGNNKTTPKLKYSAKMKAAIKFTLTATQSYIGYEDFGRCFSTPLLNANAITRSLAQNNNIVNKFEEWEFCRLWMEDADLNSNIDICFAYANDNYDTNVNTLQKNWTSDIFFSQVLGNLNIKDFSQNSIDYSNYNADVEYDENNFRFKYDSNMYNTGETILTTPLAFLSETYDYHYGDITNEDIDMSYFDYGLMDVDVVYQDNHDDTTQTYSGMHLISGPYFQAIYNPQKIEMPADSTNNQVDICWSNDSDESGYNPDACIVGVSFNNGLEIKDEYTNLKIDIFPNLRDCQEGKVGEDGKTITPTSISETGLLIYNEKGEPYLDNSKKGLNTSKYVDEDGYYYIPANTLEIVVSLNQNGLIEDNNATYGKAYLIDVPLRSCKHTSVSLNLSDLYGSTIYSIGIRTSTKKDTQGNYVVGWTTIEENDEEIQKNPSLHEGDILGIGNISFESYNIKPYLPYIYTGDSSRWNWTPFKSTQSSIAYIIYESKDTNGANPYYSYMPIIKTDNPKNDYEIAYGVEYYTKDKTTFKYIDREETVPQLRKKNNRIQIYNGQTLKRTSTDLANNILFFLNSQDGTGSLFKINTNIDTTPYDWVNIKYNLEILQSGEAVEIENGRIISQKDDGYTSGMEIMKGEIFFDLYDTTDIIGSTPIEKLSLPAWGKVQEKYGEIEWRNGNQTVDKTVNAWFKLHTDTTIKTIVVRRENPTGRQIKNVNIVLQDIVFLNTTSVPALGPQMHIRIYPEDMSSLINTKIRKFGCVYRLG